MNIENIEEMIEQFSENHPIWFWVIVRLIACTTIMLGVIFALLAVAGLIFAIAALIGGYYGFLAIFLFSIPVLCVCAWAAFNVFALVWGNYLEEW